MRADGDAGVGDLFVERKRLSRVLRALHTWRAGLEGKLLVWGRFDVWTLVRLHPKVCEVCGVDLWARRQQRAVGWCERSRQAFSCNLVWSIWRRTLGSLLLMVQFLPAPLRAGLGIGVWRGLCLQCSHQTHLLSFLLQDSLCHSCRINPSWLSLLQVPHWVLQLRGAGKWQHWHCPVSPCDTTQREEHGTQPEQNQDVLSHFLQHLGLLLLLFFNCLGSSVSENHNEGKFSFEQSDRHSHTQKRRMIWKKIPQTPFAWYAERNGNKGGHCLYSTTLRHVIFSEVSREHLPHFTACEAYHLEQFWSPVTCSQVHIFHNRPCAPIRISEFLLRGICKQFKAVPHKQMWEPPDHRLPLEQTKIWCYSYLPVPVRVQTGNLVFPLMSTTFFSFSFFWTGVRQPARARAVEVLYFFRTNKYLLWYVIADINKSWIYGFRWSCGCFYRNGHIGFEQSHK